jgi:hypothetical protein
MYYFVKFATDGVRDERPVVNEGTPVFRNMVFENIICDGAETAVFIRGLPEMKVQNISLSNSEFTAGKGAEITDAEGIRFNQVKLIDRVTKTSSALQPKNSTSANE